MNIYEIILVLLICIFLLSAGALIWAVTNRSKLYQREREKIKQKLRNEFQANQAKLDLLNLEIDEKKKLNESLLEMQKEARAAEERHLNELMAEKREKAETQLNQEIDEWAESAQDAATYHANLIIDGLNSRIAQKQDELSSITKEIDNFREVRKSINAEIARTRAIEENQAFYRVVLSDADKEDINVIQSFKNHIHNQAAINKLIWDVYIKTEVDKVVKNVLKGESFSGIYKFTNIRTQQIYIGKSTDLKKRVVEHYKSAFDLGTIADSMFHATLRKDGVDSFTYEVLEKCPKENLTEREKYYILFYESNKYGYNQRIG